MASKPPAVEMLPNGDILVPIREGPGDAWTISRVTPKDNDYADWLSIVQKNRGGRRSRPTPPPAARQTLPRRSSARKPISVGAIAVVAILAFLYFSGRLDPVLVKVGLNYGTCVQNDFTGVTFCDSSARTYCNNLASTGIDMSRSGCASILGGEASVETVTN